MSPTSYQAAPPRVKEGSIAQAWLYRSIKVFCCLTSLLRKITKEHAHAEEKERRKS